MIIDDWTVREDNLGCEGYALKHMRIREGPDDFLDRVLLHSQREDEPSGARHLAMSTALASFTPASMSDEDEA